MKITITIKGRETVIETENGIETFKTTFLKRITVNDLIEYLQREHITNQNKK